MFSEQSLFLQEDAPQAQYRPFRAKSGVHWGQRKLLMTELLFLHYFYRREDNPIFVYAGAAPGNHVEVIRQLYPNLEIHLYDPRPFQIKESEKVHIHNEYFTDITGTYWATKSKVLFLSDIRITGVGQRMAQGRDNPEETEREVEFNMLQQQRWVEIIRPLSSLLKFRLPYILDPSKQVNFEYLDGRVMLQPWAPLSSTETRLIPTGGFTSWDANKYESQMFYHNTVSRKSRQMDPIPGSHFDGLYDSTAEYFILAKVLGTTNKQQILSFSKDIDRILGGNTEQRYQERDEGSRKVRRGRGRGR